MLNHTPNSAYVQEVQDSFVHRFSKRLKKISKIVWNSNEFQASDFLPIANGPKTVNMLKMLKNKPLVGYDPENETLLHREIEFHFLKGSNEHIAAAPVVCVGSTVFDREIISYDPQNSPLIDEKHEALISYLKEQDPSLSTQQVLKKITTFINEKIFDPISAAPFKTDAFLDQWIDFYSQDDNVFAYALNGEKVPVIPIDDFVQARTGVCRHRSFVAAILLDKLVKDDEGFLPTGKVYYVRDQLSAGGHAWNLFLTDCRTAAWHVDSLWGVVKDLRVPEDVLFLQIMYGKEIIRYEISRFLKRG